MHKQGMFILRNIEDHALRYYVTAGGPLDSSVVPRIGDEFRRGDSNIVRMVCSKSKQEFNLPVGLACLSDDYPELWTEYERESSSASGKLVSWEGDDTKAFLCVYGDLVYY